MEEAIYQNNEFLGWVNKKEYEDNGSLRTLVSVQCEFAPNHYRTIYLEPNYKDIVIK